MLIQTESINPSSHDTIAVPAIHLQSSSPEHHPRNIETCNLSTNQHIALPNSLHPISKSANHSPVSSPVFPYTQSLLGIDRCPQSSAQQPNHLDAVAHHNPTVNAVPTADPSCTNDPPVPNPTSPECGRHVRHLCYLCCCDVESRTPFICMLFSVLFGVLMASWLISSHPSRPHPQQGIYLLLLCVCFVSCVLCVAAPMLPSLCTPVPVPTIEQDLERYSQTTLVNRRRSSLSPLSEPNTTNTAPSSSAQVTPLSTIQEYHELTYLTVDQTQADNDHPSRRQSLANFLSEEQLNQDKH